MSKVIAWQELSKGRMLAVTAYEKKGCTHTITGIYLRIGDGVWGRKEILSEEFEWNEQS